MFNKPLGNSSKNYEQKNSFFYLVLKALKCLHGSKKTAHGARLKDIVNYFDQTYNFVGDLQSQVRNALDIGEERRFIKRKGDKFTLVSPVATLQLIPSECQMVEIDRIQKIFEPAWWTEKERSCVKKSKTLRKCGVDTKKSCINKSKNFRKCGGNDNTNTCRCSLMHHSEERSFRSPKRQCQKSCRDSSGSSRQSDEKKKSTYTLGNTFKKFAKQISNQLSSTTNRDECTQYMPSKRKLRSCRTLSHSSKPKKRKKSCYSYC
ncbi:unnamed protein product [Brassicogethes aeneus]|uniref:Uncharacterized protein n=1 Tax=Brassicogethes aeneus TaxID=1431903 RepID=A0A9P0BBC9_BRAAE|nr:unnamed protein product [Brassicogethes aeneus]